MEVPEISSCGESRVISGSGADLATGNLVRYCYCGEVALLKTSWLELNPGRRYYKCKVRTDKRHVSIIVLWLVVLGSYFFFRWCILIWVLLLTGLRILGLGGPSN